MAKQTRPQQKTDLTTANQTWPEQNRPDHSKTDLARAKQTQPEQNQSLYMCGIYMFVIVICTASGII